MFEDYPIHDLEIPSLLSEIVDCPKKMYLRGTFPAQDAFFLAVVGSRKYTAYGRQVCESLIKGLRGYPIVIVSGLALGIDGIAHQAALEASVPTIAVPGSGLGEKVLYPATHRALAHRILQSGGALVSEFAEDWKPRPESFPQRNRIMAGMCHAVLVIEAELRSGTLITSRLATEYNRDVLTVPGSIFSETSQGPHMLLQKGAGLITSSADILEVFGIEQGAKTPQLSLNLTNNEGLVQKLLYQPLPREELTRQLSIPISEANVLLSSLELKGLIRERLGYVEWVA